MSTLAEADAYPAHDVPGTCLHEEELEGSHSSGSYSVKDPEAALPDKEYNSEANTQAEPIEEDPLRFNKGELVFPRQNSPIVSGGSLSKLPLDAGVRCITLSNTVPDVKEAGSDSPPLDPTHSLTKPGNQDRLKHCQSVMIDDSCDGPKGNRQSAAGMAMGNGRGRLIHLVDEIDLEMSANDDLNHLSVTQARSSIVRDKVTYVVCCVLTCLLAYFLFAPGKHLALMCTHSSIFITLIGYRYWVYQKRKWQFFLIDWCYAVNLVIIVWAFVFNQEPSIFCALYSMSFGLVLWSVPLYQNSVVPHSIDKLTSCYVHLMPAIIMFKFRWAPSVSFLVCTPVEDFYAAPLVESNCPGMDESKVLLWLYGGAYAAFLGHMLFYLILTSQPKVRNNPEYLTGQRLLLGRNKDCFTIWIMGKGPGVGRKLRLVFGQQVFFLAPMIPVYILFRCFYMNVTLILLMLVLAAWNGANFYAEIFVVKYSSMHSHYYNKRLLKKGLLRTVGTQCHPQTGDVGENTEAIPFKSVQTG